MSKKKSSAGAVVGILMGGAALAVVIYFVADYNFFLDLMVAHQYEPSAQMAALIEDIELTSDGERILKASLPVLQNATDFNENCGNIEEGAASLGCLSNSKIYIYDIENEELEGIKQTVLAHEMLHAVWQRERKNTRNDLEILLRQVYASHQDELASHMEFYSSSDEVDELHSVIGTQIPYSEMPVDLVQHYKKYFRNQAKIVEYYNSYSGKFIKIQNRMVELGAQINELRTEINANTKSYNEKYAKLNADIADFNYRANNVRGAATMDEYNSLNERKSKLLEEYNALTKKIQKVNELIAEYNSDYEYVGNLYESIDSNSAISINELEKESK